MALPMKPLPPSPLRLALEEQLKRLKDMPPMTPAQLRAQRISWAYGNCSLDNPNITREMVERVHDEMYGKPETAA